MDARLVCEDPLCIYKCDVCKYETPVLCNYKKHSKTEKHIWRNYVKKTVESAGTESPHVSANDEPLKREFLKLIECLCGKKFKSRSGAWKHQKMCATVALAHANEAGKDIESMFNPLNIMALIKQNQEFKDLMMEQQEQHAAQTQEFQNQLLQIAKTGINVTNNTNNNTTNASFNLNIFLNETCKDAINMKDFVKTLPITMSDLEETGKLGYTDGISRLFVNGLKGLDVNKRPIHCSDFKREVLYIKDFDVWEKDGEEKNLIKQAIRMVESKNIKLIPMWVSEHPGVVKSDHRKNTQYLNIIYQSTGGEEVDNDDNLNKIIKNILKEVRITK